MGLRTVPNANASRGVSSHRPSTATASGCKLSQAANIHKKMPIQSSHKYSLKAAQPLKGNSRWVRLPQRTTFLPKTKPSVFWFRNSIQVFYTTVKFARHLNSRHFSIKANTLLPKIILFTSNFSQFNFNIYTTN